MARICSSPGCTGKHSAKGYCHKHWQRLWKHGDAEYVTPRGTLVGDLRTIQQHVSTGSGSCALWTRRVDDNGYGVIADLRLAHRVAYELAYGPIPKGMTVDHKCFVTNCVNPRHLQLLSRVDNSRRQRSAWKPACKNGHEFTVENTYTAPGMRRRQCKKCQRAASARYKARKRARAA